MHTLYSMTKSFFIIYEILEDVKNYILYFKRPTYYEEDYLKKLQKLIAPGKWLLFGADLIDGDDSAYELHEILHEQERCMIPYSFNTKGEAIAAILDGLRWLQDTDQIMITSVQLEANDDDTIAFCLCSPTGKRYHVFASKITTGAMAQDRIGECIRSAEVVCDKFNGLPVFMHENDG